MSIYEAHNLRFREYAREGVAGFLGPANVAFIERAGNPERYVNRLPRIRSAGDGYQVCGQDSDALMLRDNVVIRGVIYRVDEFRDRSRRVE